MLSGDADAGERPIEASKTAPAACGRQASADRRRWRTAPSV